MPDSPITDTSPVTTEELQVLLRIAGLTVPDDHAHQVLAELNVQLAHAATLDRVLVGAAEPDFAPYDPTFPKIRLEDDAE